MKNLIYQVWMLHVTFASKIQSYHSRQQEEPVILISRLLLCVCNIYSYFEKGCRKKCMRQAERYCGCFGIHCSSEKFERIAREAMDICLRVLKESNKRMFDGYIVRNGLLIISHITFQDCHVHIFTDNLSRNSCM